MDEKNLNAEENEEVVYPQSGANDTGDIAKPREAQVDAMTDDEFDEYINTVREGRKADMPESEGARDGADKADDVHSDDAPSGDAQSDAGDEEENAPSGDSAEGMTDADKPFRVFSSREEYQGEIDRIIGERLKSHRESMSMFDSLKRQARNLYAGVNDDNEAVHALIKDLQSQNAEARGMDIQKYREQEEMQRDALLYREERAQREEYRRKIMDIQSRWSQETDRLKRVIPDFDLDKAFADKAFHDSLVSGASVAEAYMTAMASKSAAMPEKKPQRRVISQNGAQRGAPAGRASVNADTMTDAEFDAYIERLRR